MSYTPIESKHLNMGIYILPIQSILIKTSCLGVNVFFNFFLLKLKTGSTPRQPVSFLTD